MVTHIAVDIGGTQTRAARYPQDSLEPAELKRKTTRAEGEAPEERIMKLIASVWPEDDQVAAIGVAAPGPLDPYEGVVLSAPNIPEWDDIPLRQKIEERFEVPVVVGNDANLAALGEWKYGAGQGHHHLVYLTVSTGIGGGVIIDDKLLLGVRGMAAELGHVAVMQDGPMCGCGQRGHLEAVAAGPAIARWTQEQLSKGSPSILSNQEEITTKMIADAAESGDDLAINALARAGALIGKALAGYLHIFNPSIVIIGGGVSLSGDFLMKPMGRALESNVMTPEYLENFTLKTAELGDEAGLMGALALARDSRP